MGSQARAKRSNPYVSRFAMARATTSGSSSQILRYVYQHSETKMEIDACLVEHTVVVSCNEKKQAIATGLKWDGSPELAGQEQADFLQVDTVLPSDAPDLMQVLLCTLAPVAFK